MMTNVLIYFIIFLLILWIIKEPMTLLLINLIIIGIALNLSEYFTISSGSEIWIMTIWGGISILGWGKLIFILIKKYRKSESIWSDSE